MKREFELWRFGQRYPESKWNDDDRQEYHKWRVAWMACLRSLTPKQAVSLKPPKRPPEAT